MIDFIPSNCENLTTDEALQKYLSPEGVLYLVMHRPQVNNAFNGAQIERLLDALDQAAEDEKVKVLVLAGSGKHFCAGGDINYMRSNGEASFDENKLEAINLATLMNQLHEFPKPTIARVQGAVFGGGVGLVCCCDMAFGSTDTKICLSEVKIGMVPATIGPYVIKAIGLRNAHRFMLSAEEVIGEETVKNKFLHGIYPSEERDEFIRDLAKKISLNGPNAVQISKALLLNLAYQNPSDEVIDYTAEIIANVRESDEGKEGLTAFLEKRKPNF